MDLNNKHMETQTLAASQELQADPALLRWNNYKRIQHTMCNEAHYHNESEDICRASRRVAADPDVLEE